MAEKDFIDITPKGVTDGVGRAGLKNTFFQETEWKQILDNAENLTLEGIDEKIKLWKASSNRHVVLKYETMKARCKNIQKSGKTKDGKIILAVGSDGTPTWTK